MKRLAAIFALAVSALLCNGPSAEAQAPVIQWRFGMNVTLAHNGNETGLRVTSVNPGSPAARGGLQPGMIILSSNGMRFDGARNDYEGVAMLQQSVTAGGGVPTTANFDGAAAVLVIVRPCGTIVQRTVYPRSVGVPTT